jgi:multidrug efflux system membrane fusion protein
LSNRIAIPLVSILALASLSCSRENVVAQSAPPPPSVRAVAAVAADVPLDIAAIGNVEAISTVDVKARLTAPVLAVRFGESQDVHRGDPLFDLDPEPLNRQITEIEANIARDIANAKQAEANIARDEASTKNALAIAARTGQLAHEGISSREQAEVALATADASRASVEADRAALDSAKASENADRARLRQTRLQLEYTKVVAPIAGRVGAIAIKQGSIVKENDTTLVTILQTEPIYVAFSVPESFLPDVRKFNAAKPLAVTATISGDHVSTGSLTFIDSAVDTATGTIKLKASFPNADRALWPGQFVNVRARLNVERDRILLSSQAVQNGPDGRFVWVLNSNDSTVAMRPVTVLRLITPPGRSEQAVVGAGIQPGDRVVSEGQLHLFPGAHVRLLTP